MIKRLLKINNDKELVCPCNIDGYILGINDFSYLFGKTYSIDEIKDIKNKNADKELFVSFNKIIYNDELDNYKKVLLEIDKLGINGIIVGDVAALTYNLKTNVILDQLHLNNSYYSINHYVNNGINGVVLTNDITNAEISKIKENTNALLFKQVFGFSHLSTSARKLVNNYLEKFNIDKKNNFVYEIKEENKKDSYKIIEDEFGTHILDGKILNLLDFDINVDYEIIDGYLIDEITFLKVLLNIDSVNDIKQILLDKYETSEGFINKETIYKVKKDER